MSARAALLLSGSLGMGHDVMAEACALSLQRRDWSTATLDSMQLLGSAGSGLGERAFRGMLSRPGVYDAFHFAQLRTGGRLALLADGASARYAVPALRTRLEEEPAELVVSVFATGAGAASRVKASTHPGLVTAVFCTDVCPHRLWVHDNTDLYLVTSATAQAYVRRFHPQARVAIVPTPVRPQFYSAPPRGQARAALGVPEDVPCVLLMAGAWGLGPLVEVAETLAAAGVHTLAVAGRNARTEAALRALATRRPQVVAFGYTDRVPELMAAADLVVTSSGDTCSEARVVGRHLLLLDVVPGHGRDNLQHELERGDADVVSLEPQMLLRSVRARLADLVPPAPRADYSAQAWEDAFEQALADVGLASPIA